MIGLKLQGFVAATILNLRNSSAIFHLFFCYSQRFFPHRRFAKHVEFLSNRTKLLDESKNILIALSAIDSGTRERLVANRNFPAVR